MYNMGRQTATTTTTTTTTISQPAAAAAPTTTNGERMPHTEMAISPSPLSLVCQQEQ